MGIAVEKPSDNVSAFSALRDAIDIQRGFRNFKPSNTRRLRAAKARVLGGIGNASLAIIGDSTSAGTGTGGGGSPGLTDARKSTPARRLAKLINASGITCQEVGVFGSAGMAGSYAVYDPRVVLGTGWSTASTGPGGAYYSNTTTTDPLAISPTESFDRIEYYYLRNSGYATFTVDVDGGAAIETINANAGPSAVIKRVVNCALGTHTINFRRTGTGGTLGLVGITWYRGDTPVLDLWNMGISGATIGTFADTTQFWRPALAIPSMAPSAVYIDLGINNWGAQTDPASFAASYQDVINAHKVASDVILVSPVPQAVAANSLATQMVYVDIIDGLARSNDLPYIDLRAYFESQEIQQALGAYYDPTHPNGLGAAEKAMIYHLATSSI